ncbi:MAG: ABC transporter permease [Myxococcales bacterium]|nr:ABC transporter permease [Myxococcales bacterium]
MDFALIVAGRYLRARRKAFVSIIGTIAVVGVALGVWALSVTLGITSGFQDAFRDKVLGVNAHVLVLKFGWDFTEYREVMASVRATPGVTGAAPFLINPMMLTRGERIAGVLVKGVDPGLLGQVLDLPTYLREGSLEGLRPPGSTPPGPPREDLTARDDRTLDDWIARARREISRGRVVGHLPSPGVDPGVELPILPHDAQGASAPHTPEAPLAPAGVGAVTATRDPSPAAPTGAMLPSGATPDTVALPEDGGDDPLDAFARQVADDASQSGQGPRTVLPGVVIGKTLAQNLGLRLGDQVRIISPLTGADAALVGRGASPRARDFRVVGIFDAGFDEYDSRLVYVDLWQAQRFFEQGDAVTGVEVKVRNIDRAKAIGRRIERALGEGGYHTLDWESLNHNLFTALGLQKLAVSFVITIIIVIAAFNVVATLVMVVLDKKREIAIMKAMGATEGAILRIFLTQGMAVGALGTGVGLTLGAITCGVLLKFPFALDSRVYLISHVPVRPSVGEFVFTAVVAMFIAMVASLIPAVWASKLTPVEGLRYE